MPITFLSDYGYEDEFAGVCRAVIARIAPEANLIDLTHGIPRHAIARGGRRCSPRAAVRARRRAPGGGRSRGGHVAARRWRSGWREATGCWSGPTTACSGRRSSASAGRSRRWTSRSRRFGWSRSRRPSTAATCSRRSPPTSPGEPASRRRARRSTPARWSELVAERACDRARTRRAHGGLGRPVRQRRPRPGRRHLPRTGCGSGGRSAWRPRRPSTRPRFTLTFADVAPGELILYEDPTGSLALAVNRGSAARGAGPRARATRSSSAPDVTAFGSPRRHSAEHRLHQRRAPASSRSRERPADGRHRGRPDRGPRPARAGAGAPPPARRCCARRSWRPLELEHALLPLAVPLAVCEAVESLAPLECRVKWPNDVWIEGAQARRGADRGAAARMGGDRDRPQPGDRARRVCRMTCAGRRPRLGTGSGPRALWPRFASGLRGWVDAAADRVRGRVHRARRARAGAGSAGGRRGTNGGRASGVAEGIDERGNLARRRPTTASGSASARGGPAARPRVVAEAGYAGRCDGRVASDLSPARLIALVGSVGARCSARAAVSCAARLIAPPLCWIRPSSAVGGACRRTSGSCEQLAGDRRGLAGHPHPGAAQHLLGLRRVGDDGGEQRDREAAVLLAGGVDDPAGVAPVGAAGGVDEQPQQALGLGPALDRVLLVQLAGDASARRQTQACAWSRRPIRLSASAWSSTLAPARRSSRGQVATTSTASSNGVGVAQGGDLGRAPSAGAGGCGFAARR